MSEQNHSGNYDHVRCPVCAYPWMIHPTDTICDRHRPTNIAPRWIGEALARHELAATASNLPASTDDAEVARRELAGGTPTREWPLRGRSADSGPTEDPMAGWPASAADGVRVERSGYLGVISTAAVKNGVKP